MRTLSIEYDSQSLEAVLSADIAGPGWENVRRACADYTDDIVYETATRVRVPWWAFLACRKAIGYHVAVYDVDLKTDPAAQTLLQDALEREAKLAGANNIPLETESRVRQTLRQRGFERPLKPFQSANIRKLARLPVGASFSVPGAGKTTEALAYFALRRTAHSRLLVIAPKNAFAVWEEQLFECLPKTPHRFVRLVGGRTAISKRLIQDQPSLMLVTYQQFPNAMEEIQRYLQRFDTFLFLDESHRIKGGPDRVIAKAVLRSAPVAQSRLILTGTPLPNALSDLVPQFNFLAPELDVDEADIAEEIRPFYVRTTKADLKLRPIRHIATTVRMSPTQRQLYELMRSELAREANTLLSRRDRQVFRRMGRSATRLLQYVSNPALLAGKLSEYDRFLGAVLEEGDSPKLEMACRRARQLARQNRKVIIWSTFVENVEVIAERLSDLGADYIHGGVEASSDAEAQSREAKIQRFHDDARAMVLVANPAACSESISLHTVCHYALYVDRNYNAGQYLQSEDRIHRIGNDDQKVVEFLVSPDTIDDSVAKRLKSKTDLMLAVLGDKNLNIEPVPFDPDATDLDDDDVLDLLEHLIQAAAA